MKILLLFAVLTTINGHIFLVRQEQNSFLGRQVQNSFLGRQVENSNCPKDRNGQVSHPEYCDKFLNCWEGKAVEGQCSHGLYFNPQNSSCDYPNNVDCMGKTDSRPSELDPRCPQPYGTFPGSRCNEFVVCHAGNATVYSCPDMHSYDKTQGVCVSDPSCPPPPPTVADPPHIPPTQVINPDNIRPLPPGGPDSEDDNGVLYPVIPSVPQKKCPIRTGFIPENNCHSVLVCVGGSGYEVNCGEQYFHPNEGKCKTEKSPLCPTFYVNVPLAPIAPIAHVQHIPQLYFFK